MLPILLRQETITFEKLSEKIVKREKPGPLIYQKLTRAKSNYSDEEGTFNSELAYLMAQSTVHKKHQTDRVPIYTVT